MSVHIKFEFNYIGPVRGFREDVWDGRMDSGVIGIVLAHPWAFGSYRLAKNKWMFIISICRSIHESSFIALAKYMGTPPPPEKSQKYKVS